MTILFQEESKSDPNRNLGQWLHRQSKSYNDGEGSCGEGYHNYIKPRDKPSWDNMEMKIKIYVKLDRRHAHT